MLRYDTGEGYPSYLFHFSNVLVLQSPGGASDHVFVFAFEKGKPRLVLKMATKDVVQTILSPAERTVKISIPPTVYRINGVDPPAPPPKVIVLKLE